MHMARTIAEAFVKITPTTQGLSAGISKALNGANIGSQFGTAFNSGVSSKMSALSGVAMGIFSSITQSAMSAVSSSMGSAISRLDTLKNFPRVMESLNIAQEDSEKVVNEVDLAIRGLPTSLDDAVGAVQRFTTKTGDIYKAKDVFVALNNALLAGGTSMEEQSQTMMQLQQAFAVGKPDMREWYSMMRTMPGVLSQVATKMGGISVDQLGESLRAGEISMEAFTDALIEMNSEGVDGFKSLAEQAKVATLGVGTSLTNLQHAITRGLTNVLDSIGQENIKNVVDGLIGVVDFLAQIIGGVVGGIIGVLSGLFGFVNDNKDWLLPITAAILGLIAGIKAYSIALGIVRIATEIATIAQAIFNATMLANPIGIIIALIGALVGAFIYAWNNIDGFAEGVMSVLTAIGQGIEWMINAFITAIEFLINALIHSIMAPFWALEGILNFLGVEITLVPTVSLPRVDFGFNQKAVSSVRKATGITAMATGGIVDSATLAVIGESGREAVLPLEGNMGWADAIAERITQDRQAFPTKITLVDADGSIIGRMKSQIRYNNLNLGLV